MSKTLNPEDLLKEAQRNIRPVDLQKMLEAHGMVKTRKGSAGPYDIYIHPQYGDIQARVSNLDNRDDAGHVRVCALACVEIAKRQKNAAIEEIKLDWLSLPPDYSYTIEGPSLKIWQGDVPECQLHFGLNGDNSKEPAGFEVRFRHFVELELQTHFKSISRLETEYGFSFDRQNGRLVANHFPTGQSTTIL